MPIDRKHRMRDIFIGSLGNLVEWYDFYAFTAFSLYFAPAFFPNSNAVVQQLNTAVIFAATFLARPFGGWLFGYLADRHGRRLSLTVSVGRDVLRLPPDRGHADLCDHRFRGAAGPCRRPNHRRPKPRRRVWRQRHLPFRDRRSRSGADFTQVSPM